MGCPCLPSETIPRRKEDRRSGEGGNEKGRTKRRERERKQDGVKGRTRESQSGGNEKKDEEEARE